MASWRVKACLLCALPLLVAMVTPAPAFVQVENWDTGSGPSTFSVSFLQPVHSGDVIVVAVGHSAPMNLSITDSLGDVYVLAAPATQGQGALSSYATEIWYAAVVADGGATPLTLTYQTNGYSIIDVHQTEYSGLRQSGAVDAVSFASSNSSLEMDGGTLVTRLPGEVIFSWDVSHVTVTDAGPGFTVRATAGADLVQDLVTAAAGAYTPTATSNDPSWMMQTVVFLPELLPDGGILVLDAGVATDDAGQPPLDAGHSPPDGGDAGLDAGSDAGPPSLVDGGTASAAGELEADLGCGCSQSSVPVSTLALLGLALFRWRGRRGSRS